MGSGIHIASAGAQSQAEALDVTANNIANASTTGYRGERVRFATELAAAQSKDASFVTLDGKRDDSTPGAIRHTENPLDLALIGDGFFSVKTPQGVRYTRAGSFQLDGDGFLVSTDGHKALGPGGNPLKIPPEAASVTVSETGEVSADGEPVGQLDLARFATNQMTREGANLYSAKGNRQDGSPSIMAGALEGSNVNVVRGMVDLVKVSRTYESLMRMIEGYRETEGRAARDLGGPK